MALTYFKRYRMEIDLARPEPAAPPLPPGYRAIGWDPALLEAHALVKYRSFRDEIDANVFPCFADLEGCQRLMAEIVRKPGFLPQSTWLIVHAVKGERTLACGTIQGVKDRLGHGSIQNVGVAPERRNLGLGTVLLARAFQGFRQAGLERATLEVTADNEAAIRLYRRLGFRIVKTVYKAGEVAYT